MMTGRESNFSPSWELGQEESKFTDQIYDGIIHKSSLLIQGILKYKTKVGNTIIAVILLSIHRKMDQFLALINHMTNVLLSQNSVLHHHVSFYMLV